MTARQTMWPRQWLMTDERMGERLWDAIARLPADEAGIVLRHYALAPDAREALAGKIAAICEARGLTLAIAADAELAAHVRAALVHNPPEPPAGRPFSRSVHSLAEAEAARDDGAALLFVSPVCPTNSHPGQKPLGHALAVEIARWAGVPAIALGGMNARNFEPLQRGGFYGWAGIDAWM